MHHLRPLYGRPYHGGRASEGSGDVLVIGSLVLMTDDLHQENLNILINYTHNVVYSQ